MNVQPKPSPAPRPMPGVSAARADDVPIRRVPAGGPRLLFTWPVEFEVEPWRP